MAVKVRKDENPLDIYTFPGCYTIIYWCVEEWNSDKGDDAIEYALCGKCASDPDFRPLVRLAECGADYEHDMQCEHCGHYLATCWLRDENPRPAECIEGCCLDIDLPEAQVI